MIPSRFIFPNCSLLYSVPYYNYRPLHFQPTRSQCRSSFPVRHVVHVNLLCVHFSPDMIRCLSKEAPFWSAFGRWFDFSPVLVRYKSAFHPYWERFGSHEEGTMFIFVATRKPAFFSETVPDDMTLMAGVDDTFETLLLMNVSNDD